MLVPIRCPFTKREREREVSLYPLCMYECGIIVLVMLPSATIATAADMVYIHACGLYIASAGLVYALPAHNQWYHTYVRVCVGVYVCVCVCVFF